MAQTFTSLLTLTSGYLALADIKVSKLISSATGQVATVAGERILGVSERSFSEGEATSALTSGVAIVEAGAAIVQGVDLEANASGLAITATTGLVFGWAMDAATQAGDFIRVRLV